MRFPWSLCNKFLSSIVRYILVYVIRSYSQVIRDSKEFEQKHFVLLWLLKKSWISLQTKIANTMALYWLQLYGQRNRGNCWYDFQICFTIEKHVTLMWKWIVVTFHCLLLSMWLMLWKRKQLQVCTNVDAQPEVSWHVNKCNDYLGSLYMYSCIILLWVQ